MDERAAAAALTATLLTGEPAIEVVSFDGDATVDVRFPQDDAVWRLTLTRVGVPASWVDDYYR